MTDRLSEPLPEHFRFREDQPLQYSTVEEMDMEEEEAIEALLEPKMKAMQGIPLSVRDKQRIEHFYQGSVTTEGVQETGRHQKVAQTKEGQESEEHPKERVAKQEEPPDKAPQPDEDEEPLPTTVKEALASKHKEEWKKAIKYELDMMLKNGTWRQMDRERRMQTISSKWVFATKRGSDGEITKFRARLVARGFSQKLGSNYYLDEVFAPVASLTTIRLLLALGNHKNMEMEQLDIDSAYLHGTIDEELLLQIPDGYPEWAKETTGEECDKRKHVLRLLKSLYGLKQSGRIWNETLADSLIGAGYRRLWSEPSVFTKTISGKRVILAVYVDDLLLLASGVETMKEAKAELMSLYSMKEQGEVSWLLGMKIHRDCEKGTLTVTQTSYAKEILKKAGMDKCTRIDTPMMTNPPQLKDGETREFNYRSIVGMLLYLALSTKPDIAEAVSKVTAQVQDPDDESYARVKRILRYIQGTKEHGLIYGTQDKDIGWDDLVQAYADASYGDCKITRKSRTGIVIEFGGTAVLWSSKKQGIVAGSTMESEYIAAATCAQQLKFIRQMLYELKMPIRKSSIQYCDNDACISITTNPISSQKAKHIDIKYHIIRDYVKRKIISLERCPTVDMKADILTKSLDRIKFEKMRMMLGVVHIYSPQEECKK